MKDVEPELRSDQRGLFRIVERDRKKLERLIFYRHPDREWGTFFQFGYRRTPWGLALTFVELLPPQPGDLDRNRAIVSFRPDYISTALTSLEEQKLAVGVVHSHPLGGGVCPSPSDDDMDNYYARLFEPYGEGRPYISLIANLDHKGRLIFSGRVYDRGTWMAVAEVLTSGCKLQRIQNRLFKAVTKTTIASSEIMRRWETLVADNVCRRLRNTTVGVVGCSGTGSPAVEALARAQIGGFVLVDEQCADISNVERIHGSRLTDVQGKDRPFKVEIMARLIREVNPDAEIAMFVGNVLDDAVLDELCRCDVLLGCTDTLHGRARLSDLATLYLLPCIDVGVLPLGEGGQIISQHIDLMRLGPNDPCAYCRGRI